jgi:plasmid replication initiation protein
VTIAARRRTAARAIRLDRSLEALPLFRLSDSADEGVISFADGGDGAGRWRVIPSPGDRLPGTFDQDVYVELLRRFHEEGEPADGAVSFTLHAFLRAMGRRVDGRTYEQLRGALGRLERTTLESHLMYGTPAGQPDVRFTLLTSVAVERRRTLDREQLTLFPAISSGEPGVARVAQRYPSHLQRVLQPAHDQLVEQGVLRNAAIRQQQREWYVDYVLGSRPL